MISSSLLKLKPVARWTRLPPPFVPFRSLCSSSSPTFGGDSKTKDDVEEDRKAKDLRTHEVLSKLRSGVLFIKTSLRLNGLIVSRGSGTGFLLTKGKAATAAHVVSELYRGDRCSSFVTLTVRAKLPGGKFHLVKVTAVDTVHDVACLGLPDGMVSDVNCISQLSLPDDLLLGQRLFYFGNTALQWSLKSAIFSAIRTANELRINNMEEVLHDPSRSFPGDLFIEADAGVESGASGGPLITEQGSVYGIVVAGGNALALASPVRYLKELLVWELEQSRKGQLVYLYGEDFEDFEEEEEEEEEEEDEDEDEDEVGVGEDEDEEEVGGDGSV